MLEIPNFIPDYYANRLLIDLKMITGKLKVLLHIQWVTKMSHVKKIISNCHLQPLGGGKM